MRISVIATLCHMPSVSVVTPAHATPHPIPPCDTPRRTQPGQAPHHPPPEKAHPQTSDHNYRDRRSNSDRATAQRSSDKDTHPIKPRQQPGQARHHRPSESTSRQHRDRQPIIVRRRAAAKVRARGVMLFWARTGRPDLRASRTAAATPVLFGGKRDSAAVFVPGRFVERDVITVEMNLSVQIFN